jgi:hypothetical protein
MCVLLDRVLCGGLITRSFTTMVRCFVVQKPQEAMVRVGSQRHRKKNNLI